MSQRNAGSAFVQIKPDARDFVRDLKRDLAGVKDPGFVIDVSADTSQATADIRRFREVSGREGVKLGVDVALGQAQADMAAFRARQRADGLTVKVDADTGDAQRQISSLRKELGGGSGIFSALGQVGKISLVPAGISLLPTAAAGLAQVAAAMQQVVQVGLAVPGAIGGAAASIGTLAFGLSGVKDAYDAVSAASDSAGKDQAAAARSSAAASNQLRNAIVDEGQARKDVAQATRDARNELRDLNVEMRGGLISESRAILEAQKAREDLASGKFSDVRDATLRVEEADQRVLEVRSRNAEMSEKLNDANTKGVQNADQVVAANERLTRSHQQVADAQAGATAAAQTGGTAADKAAQAMGKISPKARDFVNALQGLTPTVMGLRNSVQEIGFDGLATRLEDTVHTLLPTLQDGLGGIAKGWNENFKQLFDSIGSDSSKGLLDRILGNTGDAQSRLTAAIDPAIHGIEVLVAAGTDGLPRMADAIGNVADRFNRFITEADKDGRLDKWINDGITAAGSLGETFLNVGKSWTAITKAAGGGALLSTIENLTGKLQTFLNSTEGQDKLRRFFDDGRAMFEQWRPILEAIPGLFSGIYDGAKKYIGGVLDVVRPLIQFLSDHPHLVATAIAAWAGWKAISTVVEGVQGTLGKFSNALTNLGTGFYPVREKAKSAMADVDDVFTKAGKSGSGMSKFSGALGALSVAGGPIVALAGTAIPLLITALGSLDDKNKESAQVTRDLEQAQKDLESTVDRVTGKLTEQSRSALISNAQNYDASGRPGGGVPGISKGNAVTAAQSLGIAPNVYADALEGKPEALQQVKGILQGNNLAPELAANANIAKVITGLGGATGGAVTPELAAAALLGDPAALKTFTDATAGIEGRAANAIGQPIGGITLTDIAKALSPTGQAAVLAGGALNFGNQSLAGVGGPTQQLNQAQYGRYRVKAGSGAPFPDGAQVNASGSDYRVTVPANYEGQLRAQNIPFTANPDGTLTATVPQNSPFVEKYAKGGPTRGGVGGGYLAEVHPNEFMISERGRSTVPDSFLHALNQGIVDPRALPKFWTGGPGDATVDQFGNPITAGAAPGPALSPAPIAPNPTGGSGGVGGIFSKAISGLQGPIGNAISLGQGLASMATQGTGAGGTGGTGGGFGAQLAGRASQVPGLIGLAGSMAISDPAAQAAALTNWGGQTASWLTNFGIGTAQKAANIALTGGNGQGGVLGALGLENSILSPSNPYNQAISQSAQFALSGPVGTLLGTNGAGGSMAGLVDPASLAPGYGTDYSTLTANAGGGVKLDDNMLAQLYGSTGDPSVLQSMSPGAQRAISYAQQHALGQKYVYGGVGTTGGYDCSGIASAIYAASQGLPQGTRYFTTESDFAALGFLPGIQPGALNIGVMRGGGGPNSHMVVTLPNGVNVESGGASDSTMYGGDAKSAGSMPLQWHLPLPPGFRDGGPTPSRKGRGPTGGFLAEVHPDEFMISARGRANVPDDFLHALNKGMVDPKDLPGLAAGGPPPIPQGMVAPPPAPPRPNFTNITPAQKIQIPAPRPVIAAPAPTPAVATPAPAPPPQSPSTPAVAQQPTAIATPAQIVAKAPGSLNHNLDAVNTGITSAASTIGTLASMAIAGGMGGAGIPGGGAAGQFAAGLIQQGGKIASKAANVVSSFLVGSAPGNFGDPNVPASGNTLRPDQNRPATANGYGTGNTTNYFQGYEAREVLRMQEDNESLKRQGILATRRG